MTALDDFPVAQARIRGYRGPGSTGPGQAAVPDPVPGADRSGTVRDHAKTVRSWPLLVLAVPAAAEVWSGWVGIAQKTGFGMVSLLPGIWPSLHLDTAVTLPVGVECYAAYALRAWLATDRAVREALSGLLLRARHGRAGRVPPHGPRPGHQGAVGHHHPRVLPPGPGPGHGDRPGPHAPRGRRSSGPRTARCSRTNHAGAAGGPPLK